MNVLTIYLPWGKIGIASNLPIVKTAVVACTHVRTRGVRTHTYLVAVILYLCRHKFDFLRFWYFFYLHVCTLYFFGTSKQVLHEHARGAYRTSACNIFYIHILRTSSCSTVNMPCFFFVFYFSSLFFVLILSLC